MAQLAKFVNLSELVLHGSGHCVPQQTHIHRLQRLVDTVLKLASLRKFSLLKFYIYGSGALDIESQSLEELRINDCKEHPVGKLNLPLLKDFWLEDCYTCSCIFHARYGEVKERLWEGCPQLATYNGCKLASLCQAAGAASWIQAVEQLAWVAAPSRHEVWEEPTLQQMIILKMVNCHLHVAS